MNSPISQAHAENMDNVGRGLSANSGETSWLNSEESRETERGTKGWKGREEGEHEEPPEVESHPAVPALQISPVPVH